MNGKLENMWKKVVMASFNVVPMQSLGGTEENQEYSNEVSRCPGQNFMGQFQNTNEKGLLPLLPELILSKFLSF